MSKVSIIIPVYNGEKSIPRCLDSVLAQDHKDIEVIVIDDGSKDGSFKVISEYAKKDKRIIPIHKENSGVSATRNVGLSMATGDYIQFIDVDDWLPFDSTKLLVRSMEEEDADMVIADFYRVIDDKISKKGSIRKGGVLTLAEYADKMLLSPADFYYGVIWNKLYRKKIIDDHHLIMDENISFSEDAIFNLQYLLHVDKIFVLKSPVYYYVKSEGSLVAKNLNIQSTVKMKTGVIRYYDSFYYSGDNERRHFENYRTDQRRVYRAGCAHRPERCFPDREHGRGTNKDHCCRKNRRNCGFCYSCRTVYGSRKDRRTIGQRVSDHH